MVQRPVHDVRESVESQTDHKTKGNFVNGSRFNVANKVIFGERMLDCKKIQTHTRRNLQ